VLPTCSSTSSSPRSWLAMDLPPRFAPGSRFCLRTHVVQIPPETVEPADCEPALSLGAPAKRTFRRPAEIGVLVTARRAREWVLLGERSRRRGGPPAAWREAHRTRGSPVVSAERPPWPRPGRVLRSSERPGAAPRRSGSEEEPRARQPRGVRDKLRPRTARSKTLGSEAPLSHGSLRTIGHRRELPISDHL
jgi:hypothetical protein